MGSAAQLLIGRTGPVGPNLFGWNSLTYKHISLHLHAGILTQIDRSLDTFLLTYVTILINPSERLPYSLRLATPSVTS